MRPLWIVGMAGFSFLTACGMTREEQLEKVAKDWSLVIRASQVIPVYPLTEDLLPGDLFLVQVPIEKQAAQYLKRGFLPFDQHLARLSGLDYATFYQRSHGIADNPNTPYHWRFPSTVPPGGGAIGNGAAALPVDAAATDWLRAPLAAFPAYSFTVSHSTGFDLALPIQGIPVGLSLLSTGSASGSVTITDAHTYGIDLTTLRGKLMTWAREQQALLNEYAPVEESDGRTYFYLRLVSRVYVAGQVNISMSDAKALDGSARGGSQVADAPETPEKVDQLSERLASLTKGAIPSGALKIAAKSARSISLVETFRRPLVVGYIAVDIPILEKGILGSFEPTHSRLTGADYSKVKILPPDVSAEDGNTLLIRRWLPQGDNRKLLGEWLTATKQLDKGLIPTILTGASYAELRKEIVAHFSIKP